MSKLPATRAQAYTYDERVRVKLSLVPLRSSRHNAHSTSPRSATYENYLPTVSISKRPDIIIAFNSGCHENPDSWPPAIVAIIDSKIPACFTSYTAEEAQKDLRVVQDVGGSKVSVKWSEEKNVWSGGRTRFDYWSEERTWSDSALWMGFQGV